MKKFILLFFLITWLIPIASAQQGISYKAIISDDAGNVLVNTPITIQFSILQDGTTEVYKESHDPTTDANGIIVSYIGEGTVIDGSFDAIDWGSAPHFLKTEIDKGEGFLDMGTTEFKVVPYALFANEVADRDDADADPANELQMLSINEDTIKLTNGGYVVLPPSSGFSGDYEDLVNKPEMNVIPNVVLGQGAGYHSNDERDITAIGDSALHYNAKGTLYSGKARANTAIGSKALFSNTNGFENTANGYQSLYFNVSGNFNTAVGNTALYSNESGQYNTANGHSALYRNISGSQNNASGFSALYSNTTGLNNTANGVYALNRNETGSSNAAIGAYALYQNRTGNKNTSSGSQALFSNETGNSNVAIGACALYHNIDRSNLVAIGDSALYNNGLGATSDFHSTYNTALGSKTLFLNSTGHHNSATGSHALYSNEEGAWNSAHGYQALFNNENGHRNAAFGSLSLYSNKSGFGNSAIGNHSQYSNTSGKENSSLGEYALYSNTTGSRNSSIGHSALYLNTTGSYNTANGYKALYNNRAGYSNVAIGASALRWNESISNLVAIGDSALYNNGSGVVNSYQAIRNTAVGSKALYTNTTGSQNTAVGCESLHRNVDGSFNIAIGAYALYSHITGNCNTANGVRSLYNNTTGYGNTAYGYNALQNNETGFSNTALGYDAGPSENFTDLYNTCAIGYNSRVTAPDMIRIGNTSNDDIGGYAAWSILSDARFKTNVQQNVPGLDFILRLNPVTFNWDLHKLDEFIGIPSSVYSESPEMEQARLNKEAVTYTGFIAQEVEEVANLIGYDFSGIIKPKNEKSQYNLSYAEFVVPLVKAIQEQHLLIEAQQLVIDELMSRIKALENR